MLSNHQGKKLSGYVPDYVVFDLETTGTSPNFDAVVEISGIRVRGGVPEAEFTTLVDPGRSIPYAASMVNGITDDMVAQSPDFETALGQFLDFAGDRVLVGHNIACFDMKFLYRDAEKYWGLYPDNDYVDTLPLARRLLPDLPHHKLVDLAAYYGLSTAGAHRALYDCHMNQQVFERLGKEAERFAASGGRICPQCGAPMVQRTGRYGTFWGCTGYPACRHTEKV